MCTALARHVCRYFEKAFHEAQGHKDAATADLARVSLGIASGNSDFESFLQVPTHAILMPYTCHTHAIHIASGNSDLSFL